MEALRSVYGMRNFGVLVSISKGSSLSRKEGEHGGINSNSDSITQLRYAGTVTKCSRLLALGHRGLGAFRHKLVGLSQMPTKHSMLYHGTCRVLGFRIIQLRSDRVMTSQEIMVNLQVGPGGSSTRHDGYVVCSESL
jgi:hypothetical protein